MSQGQANQGQKLFENLVPLPVLLDLLQQSLKTEKKYTKATVYRWIAKGCPSVKIRGDRFFDPSEVADWLKRTS